MKERTTSDKALENDVTCRGDFHNAKLTRIYKDTRKINVRGSYRLCNGVFVADSASLSYIYFLYI